MLIAVCTVKSQKRRNREHWAHCPISCLGSFNTCGINTLVVAIDRLGEVSLSSCCNVRGWKQGGGEGAARSSKRAPLHMKGCYSMERTGDFHLAICTILPFWILCTVPADIPPRDT